jgi:hypothetical protein
LQNRLIKWADTLERWWSEKRGENLIFATVQNHLHTTRIARECEATRDMLDDEPMTRRYLGENEVAGISRQITRRRALIGDASRVVDVPRQRGFCGGIDDNDVAGR